MNQPSSTRKQQSIADLRDEVLADPQGRSDYVSTVREIEMVDTLVRTLDARRIELGISKAELSRRIAREPSTVRRLFTAGGANPEIAFLAEIAEAVGLQITLAPRD
jgi:ribosome-binding protein aMBF1 (putative translation factor)